MSFSIVTDTNGNQYYVIGKTDNDNVLHVNPVIEKFGGMNFCTLHNIAYKNHETCELCRLQVVTHPVG